MNGPTPELPPEPPRKPDAWELVCSGILHTEFGRRPSRAVNNAILQLAADEAAAGHRNAAPAPTDLRIRINQWIRRLQSRNALAFGIAIILVVGLPIYFIKSRSSGQNPAPRIVDNTITDASETHWGNNSLALKVGSKIPAGWLRLDSGVVEITFASAARVAIEGPAQFQLIGSNSMELQAGKLSTDVPRRAHGFSVKTPTATITDLGTRFGAIVGGDQSSEVDVFQGRVQLKTENGPANTLRKGMAMVVDQHGAISAGALPETAFPQPNLAVDVRPQNCGFDVSGRTTVGDVPVDFGYWSGQAYSLTGSTRGINTASGPGMLEFFNSSSPHGGDSEVWQLIDLRPYKNLLASGAVEARLSALFNRVAGDANSATKFGLTLAAYHGPQSAARDLWANRQTRALALAENEFASDNKPETWEKLEADAKLPPETDFVIIQIRAIATPGNPGALAGHFADRVDLWLRTPMRPSALAIK